MNPIAMAAVIVSLLALFAWSAHRRMALLRVGGPTHESRVDNVGERLKVLWTYAFWQKKMRYYLAAGLAHQMIFVGFSVLLLRTLILWGRGFVPDFNLFILGPEGFLGLPLGSIYSFAKDIVALMVIAGALVFVYYRTVNKQKRMKLGWEGLLILGIIITMMLSDILYDGAATVLNYRYAEFCANPASQWCAQAKTMIAPLAPATGALTYHPYPEPAGSAAAMMLSGASIGTLVVIGHIGFWTHASLVLIFLNILPYSKHFHILTVMQNVFLMDLTPKGRLKPMAENSEALMGIVEQGMELDEEDMHVAPIGYARIQHFTWKDVLDMYTCTECGRCSDNCPAATTGKILSPKYLTLDLRDHLYQRQDEVLEVDDIPRTTLKELAAKAKAAAEGEESDAEEQSDEEKAAEADALKKFAPINLVPDVVHEDVLWACTTCRACEEMCPVNITYVDKIVQMRRNLVTIQSEFPHELQGPFDGMETNGNPWNLSRMDRANWAEGLELTTFADKPDAEVLYWVGCAASYDDRAKKISRSTSQLLQMAGVDFAVLAEEESCTGDSARRAGNEYLYMSLAEANIETLNGYQEKGGIKKIVTTCPHCFNTLLNEYPDLGGKYEVVHHTDYLLGLVAEGKLKPKHAVKGKVVYHDSCYLGRYNDVYDAPRDILAKIPGVELVEPEYWKRNKGLCCGAGGAQMWMEEQNKDRVNIKRTKQLLDTGATTIASACPFCMTMLTDGIKAEEKEDEIKQLDVVELLAKSCGVVEPGKDGDSGGDEAPAEAAE